ncbi:Aste57867_8502 [Aphanomyces stellatus]|uniref:Aste57867_8502 protein n=1 Tax=Aphanomyces stellatus TaxID=120398 RepID=A0A485KKJ5_9STRA|nr:hypothetical protein As57867_008470 [Aphanomyces stellatus]VFT85388.1 Aste57867_8502 [Aphanomyces stellatus]
MLHIFDARAAGRRDHDAALGERIAGVGAGPDRPGSPLPDEQAREEVEETRNVLPPTQRHGLPEPRRAAQRPVHLQVLVRDKEEREAVGAIEECQFLRELLSDMDASGPDKDDAGPRRQKWMGDDFFNAFLAHVSRKMPQEHKGHADVGARDIAKPPRSACLDVHNVQRKRSLDHRCRRTHCLGTGI